METRAIQQRPSGEWARLRHRPALLRGVLGVEALLFATFALLYALEARAEATGRDGLWWLAIPLVFCTVGWCQYAIVQALHEAAHRVLGARDWPSRCTAALLLYPLGLTRQFRSQHLAHHRHFGEPALDPDYAGFGEFPRSRVELISRMAYHASGLGALRSFFAKVGDRQTTEDDGLHPGREFLKLVATQALIFAAFCAYFTPWHYFGFWVLPIVSAVQLLTNVRLLCEHADPDGPVWRSFDGGPIARNFLGSFGLAYHAEHHISPGVPFENLRDVSASLGRGEGSGPPIVVPRYEVHPGGHLALLREWFAALPLREAPETHQAHDG